MLNIFTVKTKEDIDITKELFVEYADSLGFDLFFQNFNEELENFPGEYIPPEGCLLLARYNDQPIGCVALRKLSYGICEMKRLYVKEEFRGLKIGKALAETIIHQARKMEYDYMRLDFIAPRIAEQLYKSLGFKEIAPYENIPIKGAVFMELKL